MKISLEFLQILDAVERHGNFSNAAAALHRVPSALSHAIAKTEADLGITLFARAGRRAQLNEAGKTLLDEGRHLLRAAQELERHVQRIAHGWEATLRIAIDAIIPSERLLPVLARFYANGYDTEIRISQEVLGGTWDALATDRADLVIGAPGDKPARSGIRTRPLCTRTDFIFAISPTHPLAAWPDAIPGSELRRHRAIVIADTSRELDARSVGLMEGQARLHVPDLPSKLAAQVAGLGIGHLPRYLAAPAMAAGLLIEKKLSEPRPDLPLHLAWRSGHAGKALAWFVEAITESETCAALTAGL